MSGVSAWATWTGGGVAIGAAPASPAAGKLVAWAEAPALAKVHPRARRPHPHSKKAVQLAAAVLGERRFERLGLAMGTSSGCLEPDLEFEAELSKKGAGFGGPSLFVYTLPTAPPGELSVAFGAHGPLVSLDAGSCSALFALSWAAREVDAGRADAVLCGAMELGVPDELLAFFLVEKQGRTVEACLCGFDEGGPSGADGALELARALSSPGPQALACADPQGFWATARLR